MADVLIAKRKGLLERLRDRKTKVISNNSICDVSLSQDTYEYVDTLDVVSRVPDGSDIRIYSNSGKAVLYIDLSLAYGDLSGLKEHNRYILEKMDTWAYKMRDFSYDFSNNIDEIKEEIAKYSNVRVWFSEYDSNSFLMPRYLFHEFYDQLKDNNVSLIYLNRFTENGYIDENIYDEYFKEENQEKLTNEDIEQYKAEWEQQLQINSDVRNLVNGKIENLSYSDLYEPVYEFIAQFKRRKLRGEIISKLMDSDILTDGKYIIYNHIINCLIKQGRVKAYPYGAPEDPNEFHNNKIRAA